MQEQKIVNEIWLDKYRHGDEPDIAATRNRVIDAVFANDHEVEEREYARELIHKGVIVPAGRIVAGAGTNKRVTLINCYVAPDIQDSLDTEPDLAGQGIMDVLKVAALTQQMGGGIGMDFSTIRPNGAVVKRTGSVSSGVLPFMDCWSAMCQTIMSSGSRRGAMMGTLAISHPDILDFVVAKQAKGRLKNFNVSVLVTDDFMEALANDEMWDLKFPVPRADVYSEPGVDGNYIYKRIRARELWDKIIENTYIHAEPGVIFIDRVNQFNNLYWLENIHCTNPCGEQPLPANGDCNLGHVNLAVMVKNPFTPQAELDFTLLTGAVRAMVRLLDNVLDITQFPTEEQRQEALAKRRIGLGYTGLANALQQLGIRYGSQEAVAFTEKVGVHLRDAAYWASIALASERGSFPLFDSRKYLVGAFVKKLPADMRDAIRKFGIRNGVLLTIAPTGTTSILVGNVSSGIEPVFLHEYERKVLKPDGVSFDTHTVYDYGYLKWKDQATCPVLPDYFVTAKDLTVEEHLAMQAAAQKYIDASISKTINCPTEMTFDEFKNVYQMAYDLGLKGCTTYRYDPRSERGQVLSEKKTDSAKAETPAKTEIANREDVPVAHPKAPMQEILEGRRYRINWPDLPAMYVCIMDYIDPKGVRRPFEIFISTKSPTHEAYIKALTRMISAIFRREDEVAFVANELKEVYSTAGGGIFYKQKYVPSILAMIGLKIEEHLEWLGLKNKLIDDEPQSTKTSVLQHGGLRCGKCNAPTVVKEEGCFKCLGCGDSKCG